MSEFLKNTSGQIVSEHMMVLNDGTDATTGVAVKVRADYGAVVAGAGTLEHVSNGLWDYFPTQAETNGNTLRFIFYGSGLKTQVVTIYTTTKRVASLNDLSAADVNAQADQALADAGLTTTVTGRIDAAISTRSTLTAQQVWEYASRTLSGFGTLIADVWAYATRTLTSAGSSGATAAEVWQYAARSLTDKAGFAPTAAEVATAVWSATTRTLSGFGTLIADLWAYATRTLTETDKAGLATETSATANKDEILTAIGGIEAGGVDQNALVDAILGALTADHNAEGTVGHALGVFEQIAAMGAGYGDIEKTYTVIKGGIPLPDVTVKARTVNDIAAEPYRWGVTDGNGEVTFRFPASMAGSDIWIWRSKGGERFTDPDQEVIPNE